MKRIHFFILFVSSIFSLTSVSAQLIIGPDTLCMGNVLQLNTTAKGASSYYWGFCSAYLNNIPAGSSIAAGTGLDDPSAISMAKDGNDYFVFVSNTVAPFNLIRYEFGNSLSNVPLATDMGNLYGAMPQNSKGFELIKIGANWFGFITGGNTAANSALVRLDFGSSLTNKPTATNFGSLGGLMLNPQDIYIFSEAGNWYGFTNNGFTGNIIRLEFGTSITNPPVVNDLGNTGSLALPTGLCPVFDGTDWHLFVVNRLTARITRLDFGSSLLNVPVDNDLGNPGGLLNGCRDMMIIRDCGLYYGYVTNEVGNNLIKLSFNLNLTTGFTPVDLGNFAGYNAPRYLTRMIRDKDNVFAFTANNGSNSISRIEYNSCSQAVPPLSTLETPPPVVYTTPGLYNVFHAVDEGLPTMQVDCQLIRVLAKPKIEISNDTLICQGDTILIIANGPGLVSNIWTPVYNFYGQNDTTSAFVYPAEDHRYYAHLEFTTTGACAYDTSMFVKVGRITADAGPDRFVADGAHTQLGGPRLSMGQEFSYIWRPGTFLNDTLIPYPICTPTDVAFYVLQVTNDSLGCVRTDTVFVKTECTDISLPNAFNPVSDIASNRLFGLLNSNIAKLEFFKIFNRWGQLVFETNDPTKKWNGTFKNIELPPDNYVWIVDGYCNNGKRVKKQGTVLLTK